MLQSWLRRVDRQSTRIDDTVVAPSEKIANILQDVYQLSVAAIIPPPVEDVFFERDTFPRQVNENTFIWTGRLVEPIKRLAMLCRIFSRLPHRELIIVGEGRSRAAVAKVAPPNVTIIGAKSRQDVNALLRTSAALLLPSVEDFGISAAEALAAGVPVIVNGHAGISGYIRDGFNGLVTSFDERAIEAAIGSVSRQDFASPAAISSSVSALSERSFSRSIARMAESS
jgi:glycosyltransferase involved in cell wall biosynthesis